MGDAIRAETLSITTGKPPQTLILDQKDIPPLSKTSALSSWMTSSAPVLPCKDETDHRKAGGDVVKEVAILTEGDPPSQWRDVLALGHLPPLFTD